MDGFVIAERGARVEGRVVASDSGGRVKGVSSLAVELVRLSTSDGQRVAIQTDGFERRAEETHRQDAAKVGAGAAIGRDHRRHRGRRQGCGDRRRSGRRRRRGRRAGYSRQGCDPAIGDAGDVPVESSGDDYREAAGLTGERAA